jgi:hypothetical protein
MLQWKPRLALLIVLVVSVALALAAAEILFLEW